MSSAFDKASVRTLRKATDNVWPGAYRGIIVNIDDPDRLGRVKVRVFALHGDDNQTPDGSLPWADIAEHGGGGYDYGGYDPPPVGSSIWCVFEGGLPEYPVVFGTYRGVPKRDADNPNVFLTKSGKPVVEKPWLPPDEDIETPKDVFDEVYGGDPHPTRRVWKKSYKGHTFIVEDGDGKEFLKIIDRAGQIIEMSCPVVKDTQAGNKAQRGVRDALRGDQLQHDIMKNRRASIRIRDLSGQEIVLDAKDQEEQVVIRSRSRRGGGENKVTLSSGKGRNRIELEDNGGDIIRLDPESSCPITIRDSSGNAIVFDRENGKIRLVSQKTSEEDVPRKSLVVRGEKKSEISGSEIKTIRGNKRTQIVSDASTGVLGNTSLSLGGSLKMTINNTSPSGPELTALDILVNNPLLSVISLATQAAKGDITIEAKLAGNVEMSTLAGNATLGTVAGNVLCGTNLGNVTCQTSAGKAELITALGTANVDGTTVHLGALLKAIHPILRGDLAVAAISAKNTTLDALAATIVTTLGAFLAVAGGPMNVPLVPASVALALPGTGQLLFLALTAMVAYFTGRPIADAAELTALTASLSLQRMVD